MDYVGSIYRPPSEANSLLLQVTEGCSHNRCIYCGMYLDKRFRPKPFEIIEQDLQEAAARGPTFGRVFLCDGDALILSPARLVRILEAIGQHLPWVERVGIYGDTRSALNKSVKELSELRELGLGIVYHGVESGDDEVLDFIDKGGTRAECIETADKLRQAGITHSVIVLLGVGGIRFSEQHAKNSGTLLGAMDPPFAAALTTTVIPITPLGKLEASGDFVMPDKFGLLRELHSVLRHAELSNCRFSSNHASNYLPLRAQLPREKEQLLAIIEAVIAADDESLLRPEWLRGL